MGSDMLCDILHSNSYVLFTIFVTTFSLLISNRCSSSCNSKWKNKTTVSCRLLAERFSRKFEVYLI
jgi:hypothetical protein